MFAENPSIKKEKASNLPSLIIKDILDSIKITQYVDWYEFKDFAGLAAEIQNILQEKYNYNEEDAAYQAKRIVREYRESLKNSPSKKLLFIATFVALIAYGNYGWQMGDKAGEAFAQGREHESTGLSILGSAAGLYIAGNGGKKTDNILNKEAMRAVLRAKG